MDIASGIALYATLFIIVFLMALPVGVRRNSNPAAGHDVGAPVIANIKKKAVASFIITSVAWCVCYWFIINQ
jgi:predicted secreted protein